MKFSKWNKRITAWLLIIAGFVMAFLEYETEYVLIFLGSGLAAIGLSVWQNVKNNGIKFGDLPPPKKEQK